MYEKQKYRIGGRLMNKLYNTQNEIANIIRTFLKENTSSLHKPQLNFLPEVIFGMIVSESSVASDISKSLKEDFTLVQHESTIKRIHRLFNNPRYEGKNLFIEIVKYIISNYKFSHNDKRVHIVIDHMYSKDNFTVLMSSMRIGKQGFPIYFECFEGINNPNAFSDTTLIKAVDTIHNLFKDTDFELVFLADRWFNSYALLEHINSLNYSYVIRLKSNLNVYTFDKKEGHRIKKQTSDLFAYQFHSAFYEDTILYENTPFTTNIVRSKKQGVSESWILATNNDPKRAIKDYGYRFGGIETIFKNQKSNGFYLEDINRASLTYFENLYSTICIAFLLLTSIGTHYTKRRRDYKNINITTHKTYKNKGKIRVMSIFNTGLTLFKIAFNSYKKINLRLNFIIHDV